MTRFLTHLRFLNWRVALRMAINIVRVRILRQRRLRNVQLALTYRCNHTCEMCSSNKLYQKERHTLTLDQWKKVVDELKALGCSHFDLTGGEPTLTGLEFLQNLVKYINRNRDCIVSLATNGTLVTGDWLGKLKKTGLNAVLFDIQPGNHDKIVGHHGNKEHILDLIHKAMDIGLNVCINTCLGTYNKDDFEDLLDFAMKKNLHVLTNLAAPTGRLTGEDVRMTKFREFYYNLMKKYPLMRSDTTYNYFGNNRCPGGREKIYITCYGDVIQCTFIQVSYGNVLEESLKVIYDRFWENPLIRKKYICKHTFWPEFREWADNKMKDGILPVKYK